MLLTDAFLALKAEFVDRRLNITGGIIGTIYVPPPIQDSQGMVPTRRIDLVILVRTGPSDHQKPFPLTIEFIDADGNRVHVLDDTIIFDNPAEGSGCWILPLSVSNMKAGSAAVIVSIDGGGKPVRVPVELRYER